MEMAGASLTLFRLDDELELLLSAPAECAFWKVDQQGNGVRSDGAISRLTLLR
jgi:hypothetical protein